MQIGLNDNSMFRNLLTISFTATRRRKMLSLHQSAFQTVQSDNYRATMSVSYTQTLVRWRLD